MKFYQVIPALKKGQTVYYNSFDYAAHHLMIECDYFVRKYLITTSAMPFLCICPDELKSDNWVGDIFPIRKGTLESVLPALMEGKVIKCANKTIEHDGHKFHFTEPTLGTFDYYTLAISIEDFKRKDWHEQTDSISLPYSEDTKI